MYTCRANNFAGKRSTYVQIERTTTLKVLSVPTIVGTGSPLTCGGATLNIKWLTDNAATSLIHRFSIVAADLKEGNPSYRYVTSRPDAGLQETTISGLQAETKYTIVVHVCPDQLCIENLNASTEVTTAANVACVPVQDVFLTSLGDGDCAVTWKTPSNTESRIQGYQIVIEKQLAHSCVCTKPSENISIEIHDVSNKATKFSLQTSPNRNYSVKIRTKTYAGLSSAVTANGSCTTKRAVPTDVLSPNLTKTRDGTMVMKIQIPDESNGPISCMFLIMKRGFISDYSNFSISDLGYAETAAKAASLPDNEQYIAFAIMRVTVQSSFSLTVGDNTRSFCNLGVLYGSMNTQNEDVEVYEGKNWPIKDGQNYCYFAVSATLVGNKVLLKSSPVHKFAAGSETSTSSEGLSGGTITLIIVCCVVYISILLLTPLHFYNESDPQASSFPNSPNTDRNPTFQNSNNNSPTTDDAIYVEMAGQSSAGNKEREKNIRRQQK